VALGLVGCARPATVEAGPSASDPLCAQVLVQLPTDLRGDPRRETTGQSTAAWGDPPVELRCGVDPLGPTTDPCVAVGAVDWVLREDSGDTTYTTYGRVPAVELRLPGTNPEEADVVLTGVSSAVEFIEAERRCL
jgi:hypothetical protein